MIKNRVQPIILLDAMGVIYRNADDVADLLIPFVRRHNPGVVPGLVETSYRLASLGELRADEFWQQMGIDAGFEDDYLVGHELMAGLTEFLDWAQVQGFRLACLSNDVSTWSRKLRQRFDLSARFEKWIISADVGVRKPEQAIYQAALRQLDASASDLLFVDDRLANVQAARALGIRSVLFGVSADASQDPGACAGFPALRQRLETELGG